MSAAVNHFRAGSELPVVRHFLTVRRAGVPAVAAVLGALVAAPAFADVAVSPTTAVQASGQNFDFHVTNNGTKPLSAITVRLPADEAIAEVYPLSVDSWAPKIEYRKLVAPLETIHGGTPVTEAADAITWLAVPGKELAPGKSADLSIAAGPLPTLSSMRFTVSTTYSGGGAGPSSTASVTLTPGTGLGNTTHDHDSAGGTGTTGGSDVSDAEGAAFAQAIAAADRGPSLWSIGGWVLAGLALAGMAVYLLRGRHRANEEDEPDDEDEPAKATAGPSDSADSPEKEPVAAGSSSKWSFKG
jgi:hypothetical protein